MASRGEFQKQMAALVGAAKAKDLTLENILPQEMLEHFQEMIQLKEAQAYIKELEEREKKLQAANDTLTKDLDEKRAVIEDLPEEFKAMKVDLKQAKRQIILHKEIAEDARERAEHYQRQLKEVTNKQQTDASTTEKIEQLQIEIDDQQALITKLVEDSRTTNATFAQLRKSDTKAIEKKDKELAKKNMELADKDKKLAEKDKELAEKDEVLAQIRYEFRKVSDDNVTSMETELNDTVSMMSDETDTMIEDLEKEDLELQEQNLNLEVQISTTKAQLHQLSLSHEQVISSETRKAHLSAAAVTEIKPLTRFYKAMLQVLKSYAELFQTSPDNVPNMSVIDTMLEEASDALESYLEMNKLMRAGVEECENDDMDHIALRKELESLAEYATDSQISVETIRHGFWDFLEQLSNEPKVLSTMNGMLCDVDRFYVS